MLNATMLTTMMPADSPRAYFVGWLGMLGIVLVLYFGLFHVLSCAYRQAGIDAAPIMSWPLTARGVSEFWAKRWNLAFRDLTHRLLFRPTVRTLGPVGAFLQPFLAARQFLTTWWLRAGYHLLSLLFTAFVVVFGWGLLH